MVTVVLPIKAIFNLFVRLPPLCTRVSPPPPPHDFFRTLLKTNRERKTDSEREREGGGEREKDDKR